MTILHINSSARMNGSHSRIIGKYLVDRMNLPVISRDLAQQPLPSISSEDLMGVNGSSEDQRPSLQAHLRLSDSLIDELRSAATLVLAAPIYNFGIPASLKHWIDVICRAGVSFKYTDQGPVGLLGVERAVIITSSGGTPIGGKMDFASCYLEHICRFIGVTDVFHIEASGSKGSPEQVIAQGKQQVENFISTLASNRISGVQ